MLPGPPETAGPEHARAAECTDGAKPSVCRHSLCSPATSCRPLLHLPPERHEPPAHQPTGTPQRARRLDPDTAILADGLLLRLRDGRAIVPRPRPAREANPTPGQRRRRRCGRRHQKVAPDPTPELAVRCRPGRRKLVIHRQRILDLDVSRNYGSWDRITIRDGHAAGLPEPSSRDAQSAASTRRAWPPRPVGCSASGCSGVSCTSTLVRRCCRSRAGSAGAGWAGCGPRGWCWCRAG